MQEWSPETCFCCFPNYRSEPQEDGAWAVDENPSLIRSNVSNFQAEYENSLVDVSTSAVSEKLN